MGGLLMNKYELLYSLKESFESQIRDNKIFNLSFSDAALVTFEKVGVFYKGSLIAKDDEQFQKYLKSKAKTNKLNIDLIPYIQESLKWMFRWYSKYCKNQSTISPEDILAEDIYNLMGEAYIYENLFIMWDLHRGKKVDFITERNKLIFDFYSENVYKKHVFYDTLFRISKIQQQWNELMDSSPILDNFEESLKLAHQTDFVCSFGVEFSSFNLKDYETFSVILASLFAKKHLNNTFGKNYIITPGSEGLIVHKKNEWIDIIASQSNLSKEKIGSIIDFFTYDLEDAKSDVSLSYFIPYFDDSLIVSESIFCLTRPEANALRLLKYKIPNNYSRAQNNFEDQQIQEIKNKIPDRFLIPNEIHKSKKNRSGMDLIVYDKHKKYLQIIELKYKIPIESATDIKNLDDGMLNKAYEQLGESKEFVSNNKGNILSDYFGVEFEGVIPEKIDFFVLTNYSIGTGIGLNLPTPILLTDHYIKLMQLENGMEAVHYVLFDNNKGMDFDISKRYCRYSFMGKKILIPEYYTN